MKISRLDQNAPKTASRNKTGAIVAQVGNPLVGSKGRGVGYAVCKYGKDYQSGNSAQDFDLDLRRPKLTRKSQTCTMLSDIEKGSTL